VFEILGQRRHGRDEIVAGPARDLAGYHALQHIITNELVDVDGDEAAGQWYAIAVHVPDGAQPRRHADVGLRYRFTAKRRDEGWRLADVALEVLWTAGLSFGIDEHGEG
jgi:SnoaL-like protein